MIEFLDDFDHISKLQLVKKACHQGMTNWSFGYIGLKG
jgi:hypothetical protein